MSDAVALLAIGTALLGMLALVRSLIRAAAAGPCDHGNGPDCSECWEELQW